MGQRRYSMAVANPMTSLALFTRTAVSVGPTAVLLRDPF